MRPLLHLLRPPLPLPSAAAALAAVGPTTAVVLTTALVAVVPGHALLLTVALHTASVAPVLLVQIWKLPN